MPWQNQGGGGSGGGGGPWGGNQSPWGRGGRPQAPNLDEILRRGQDRFRRLLPGGWGSGRGVIFVLVALVLVWLASGIYFVQPDQVGIVLRFGAFNRKTTPGANYHLPYPIETVLTPSVTRVNTIEIGEPRAQGEGFANAQEPQASRMLTGDENLLDVYFTVQYVVKDAPKFLFNIRNPNETVKAVAESAMREVIGHTPVTDAIVGGDKIASETQALLQRILDEYQSGVQITSVNLRRIDLPSPDVIAAFADVQNAKTERDSKIIQAKTYSNNILPRAKGEAAQIVQAAEAYRQQVVLHAEGDASRFLAVYQAYKQAPDVTAQRLYIETMQNILTGANKVILDKAAGQAGVVPYLPLPELKPPSPPANRAAASAAVPAQR
jgi:modulator of FtsH protease HflK